MLYKLLTIQAILYFLNPIVEDVIFSLQFSLKVQFLVLKSFFAYEPFLIPIMFFCSKKIYGNFL